MWYDTLLLVYSYYIAACTLCLYNDETAIHKKMFFANIRSFVFHWIFGWLVSFAECKLCIIFAPKINLVDAAYVLNNSCVWRGRRGGRHFVVGPTIEFSSQPQNSFVLRFYHAWRIPIINDERLRSTFWWIRNIQWIPFFLYFCFVVIEPIWTEKWMVF